MVEGRFSGVPHRRLDPGVELFPFVVSQLAPSLQSLGQRFEDETAALQTQCCLNDSLYLCVFGNPLL